LYSINQNEMIVSIDVFSGSARVDIELLRTFLEVNRTRHFGRAAENLFLTQSAVSARVRQLEETLGTSLFVRQRNDIQLTAAGRRFLKHAESILTAWHRARQDAALPGDDRSLLAIGGMFGLWDILLQGWIQRLYRSMPELALVAEAGGAEALVRKLLDGTLDLAVMFDPPQLADLEVREVGTLKLVLVSTEPGLTAAAAVSRNYVKVDWGTSFAIAQARHFPDMQPPALRMGLGRLALGFLLECGGSAYLAEAMAEPHIEAGRLHRVVDAPVVDRQVYAVYPRASARQQLVERALAQLLPPPAESEATTELRRIPG